MKASDFVNDLRKKFPEEYKKNGDRGIAERLGTVSYTHLDVYKRQLQILPNVLDRTQLLVL